MNRIKSLFQLTVLLLSALVLNACGTISSGRPQLQNASELQSNEVAIVGRIELVPPLSAEEQELQTGTSERFRGKAVAVFSDKLMDLDDLPMGIGNDAVMAKLGKDFFARMQKRNEYIYSGSFILARSAVTSSGYMGQNATIHMDQINLPGGLKYAVKPGDRAIYVGTLRYYRDDFNSITKVKYIDDYKRVSKTFAARFGKGIKLRDVKPQKM